MRQTNSRGFTLIEVLIYLALFTFIISGVLAGVYQIIDSTEKISRKIFIEQEGNFLLRKIDWALTGAGNTSVSAGGDTLSLDKLISGVIINLKFDSDSGRMRLTRDSGTPVNLSSDSLELSDLQFTHPLSPDGVKASFKINGQQFETTKYLR